MTQQQAGSADGELARQYDPGELEQPIYDRWLDADYFHAEVTPGKPRFSITIPPPNVTGELHMGHALCYTIHDVLVRWKRMQGLNVLCLPGTDHAGIAAQNVVEKMLAAEGLTRHDLGREAFVERVWEWKAKYGEVIIGQLKKLGCSFDWERERFTMDAAYSSAVIDAFIALFNKGYIYRGTRVTHWCPRCQTALSDIEVDDQEQAGSLWYFKYPVENGYAFGTEYLVIATTRPETMLGDTAVAVHPEDRRYQHLIGRHILLPLTGRRIPIIADPILVDMEFGTGALKVTPAHDLNDFEAGERNGLPQITVIGEDGRMTAAAGPYAGMDRFEARQAIVDALQADQLLDHIEDYTVQLPICDRCKTVLEPLLSEQWYCRMQELAAPAIRIVESGQTRFVPERWGRVYLDWMEKLRDWCVSRQLWWGHRIPIYHCESCGHTTAARAAPESCEKCGAHAFTQDPDVLDTWFSSSLWPFATLGWPEETPELAYFYPTDVLITARDIIYLWVARMLMMGLEFRGELPFPQVYIYATVLDARGDRMSKSKGNGIDPMALVQQFGADATRYGIVTQAGKSQQIRFSESIVAQARLFCSKIWQASRFVLMNLPETPLPPGKAEVTRLEDRWILSRLARAEIAVNEGLERYDLDVATRVLHDFIWSDFCDWYIELSKPRLAAGEGAVRRRLYDILDTTLRLLHPFVPFLTEAIWQQLPGRRESIMVAPFPVPEPSAIDAEAEEVMSQLMDVVVRIRNMRSELKVTPGMKLPVFLAGLPAGFDTWLDIVEGRARCQITLESADGAPAEQESAISSSGNVRIRIPLAGLVDFDKERIRLTTEIGSIGREIEGLERQLANPQFVSRAPEAVVTEKRDRLAGLQARLKQAEEARERLGP